MDAQKEFKKSPKKVNQDKIISLAREYVENTTCTCTTVCCCWRCLFQHSLHYIPAESDAKD